MYVSMWMIRDFLKAYHIDTNITNGEMRIRNASLLHHGKHNHAHTLYICPSEKYFPTIKNKIICANQNDFLIVDHDDLEEIFELVQDSINEYLDWDLDVQDMILDNCTLQDITDKAASMLKQMVCVQNSAFMIHGIAGKEYMAGITPQTYLDALIPGKAMEKAYTDRLIHQLETHLQDTEPYLFQEPTLQAEDKALVQNLFINGHFWGFSYTTLSAGTIDIRKKQMLTIYTQQVLSWWEHNNQPLAMPAQNEFFLRLLSGQSFSDWQLVWSFLSHIGWEKEDEKHIIKITEPHGNRLIYSRLIHHISQMYSYCYVLEYDNAIVLVLNTRSTNLESFLKEIETFFWNSKVVYGISYPFYDVRKMPLHYEQASIALRYALQTNQAKMHCNNCLLLYARDFFKKNMETDIYHPLLHDLAAYDETHDTEFFSTLREYLIHERSVQRACAALNIHKNTLLGRIRRIKDLFALDLDNEEERQSLILSFLLY